jgi:VWFA-related protein
MVYGNNMIWTAALLLAASTVPTANAQPQAAPAPTQQKQDIPDAPRPQTLPNLKTITPLGAAVAPPALAEQAAPATAPTAAQQPEEDQGPPPDRSAQIFTLPTIPVNLVEVPFIVKDSRGQLVPGITAREVRVYENNVPQHMAVFTTDPFPLSVALVIDQSVTYDEMDKINASLAALQGAFAPYDEVAIFTYNNGVREQTPFTGAQGPLLAIMLDRSKGHGRDPVMPLGGPLSNGINLNGSKIDDNTSGRPAGAPSYETAPKEFHTLNDAILAAARETARAGKGRRRIVYVISDGKEYGSKASEKEVIKYCLTNNVSVWATLVGDSSLYGLGFLDRIHIPLMMRDNALPRYTSATAGQLDAEFRQKGIEASFGKITAEARNQYTIGYYSHEPMLDGQYRKLDVRVSRPDLTIIAKEGYWPRPQTPPPPPPPAPPHPHGPCWLIGLGSTITELDPSVGNGSGSVRDG